MYLPSSSPSPIAIANHHDQYMLQKLLHPNFQSNEESNNHTQFNRENTIYVLDSMLQKCQLRDTHIYL